MKESNIQNDWLGIELDLSSIEEVCVASAEKEFLKGDGKRFAGTGYSQKACLTIVADNVDALLERGIFEPALIAGYTGGKTNHAHIELEEIEELFSLADREALRKCGDPLPPEEPFKLYRGVSGENGLDRKRGFSWTSDLAVACSFAFGSGGNQHVFVAICSAEEILCFVKDRDEEEFIIQPTQVERLEISDEEIKRNAIRLRERRTANKPLESWKPDLNS